MKNLLFLCTIISLFILTSCSDSSTGPGNDDDNGDTTTYTVSVDMDISGAGTISPAADSTYDEGDEINLEAIPNGEYQFTHWSGDVDSTADNPLSITVDQDYSLTANFMEKTYDLTINTQGEGTVTEEIVQQKSTDYEAETRVRLIAEPAEGWEFVEWQGDYTGTDNPAQITMDASKEDLRSNPMG